MFVFLSGIATREDVIISDYTDSHESILMSMGLNPDITPREDYALFEYNPDSTKDLADIEEYKLRLNQEYIPSWWDEREPSIIEYLRSRLKKMIVTDNRRILLGGKWILAGKANVETAKNAIIIAMYDSSKIGALRGSSRVGDMYDSSQIRVMYDSSAIQTMRDFSNVWEMRNSSYVRKMNDLSWIRKMRESSHVIEIEKASCVREMRDLSRIDYIAGLSRVGVMRESSRIDEMRGSSAVEMMVDESRVMTMYNMSRIFRMCGSSAVREMYGTSHAPRNPLKDNREKLH